MERGVLGTAGAEKAKGGGMGYRKNWGLLFVRGQGFNATGREKNMEN